MEWGLGLALRLGTIYVISTDCFAMDVHGVGGSSL
jgi:hypothetical protein